ncbi:uncharacterized protein GGS22DRAFT_184968 [Annulohypoxylon maeteangense]|uniref:uncharacterized protein n=1 Tax=Annulohypoxylon maeteangense TaxID=1927788 RepID=UPI002007F97A|nr:uncharacterized protein GGS22DRAFT_184968 [Annulohypoxylon maeteangense]KAI0889390.1 hypothetical protein GGS22DRAFT_184968 [Annulohypoxylon maeteangense]
MAAPSAVTMHNLSGIWVVSKYLSDDAEPCYKLQGMPWALRKFLSLVTITNRVTQTSDEKGCTRIKISSTISGGFEFDIDPYILDGRESSTAQGSQRVRAHWIDFRCPKLASFGGGLIDPYLTQDWLEDASATTWDHVYIYILNARGGWTAEYVWGFALKDGQRHFVKKVLMRKGEYSIRMAIVHDWNGPLPHPD